MDEQIKRETENLTRAWMQHDEQVLRTYLTSGVEDPRINIQSILARHALTVAISGNQFERLMEHELRFATVLNWARNVFAELGGPEDLNALRHALRRGADNGEGIPIPCFVTSTFGLLPEQVTDELTIPNYIEDLINFRPGDTSQPEITEAVLSTFQAIWKNGLASTRPPGLSVLELACGSANDYRFLDAFGLAALIDYTGLDLCEKNISNAKAMFPQARFLVGNAMAIESADRAFDYCIVQDLFEHLSLDAMELALAEICRVTRRTLCLGFFNLHELDEHLVQPLDHYHWNTLSLRSVNDLLEHRGFQTQVVHIDTFLRWRFGCAETHNKNAYTLFAARTRD